MSLAAFKEKFLLAALPDVPFDGWSASLMDRTAEKIKAPAKKITEAFPNGVSDLAEFFFEWAADETVKKLKKSGLGNMRIRDRITTGVRIHLEIFSPYKASFSGAMGLIPLQLPKLVWKAADKIWLTAGDTSTDYNRYTKRALLSGVITSTTLYWLNDSSKNHEKSWNFLDSRIENVLMIGQTIGRFKSKKER